jgi:hypothetical protein
VIGIERLVLRVQGSALRVQGAGWERRWTSLALAYHTPADVLWPARFIREGLPFWKASGKQKRQRKAERCAAEAGRMGRRWRRALGARAVQDWYQE